MEDSGEVAGCVLWVVIRVLVTGWGCGGESSDRVTG